MNAAVTNMAVMFGAMQVAKRIPFDENPEYVRYAQLVYVTSQLLCLAVFYYCSILVRCPAGLPLSSSARTTLLCSGMIKPRILGHVVLSYVAVAGPW